MAKHTTFKIGGPVDYFVIVDSANGPGPTDSTNNLVQLLKYLDGEGMPYFIVGSGSNMLVRDEGFRGVAIQCKMQNAKCSGETIEAESGCITVEIARLSMKAGLTGFEWGVGVPGTIGGAVRGNAGAMGGEMKDVVSEVEIYRNGEMEKLSNKDCEFGYRDSVFKHQGGVVLRVTLQLAKSDPSTAAQGNALGIKKALEHIQYRNKTQPQGHASIGCIFKNFQIGLQTTDYRLQQPPPVLPLQGGGLEGVIPKEFITEGKVPAGWFVEQSGMKGVKVGQAQVSERHGNFIVNLGGATAQDVQTLVEQIKQKVYDTYGVELEEEIQII